ncbi:hypothetical protein E4U26_006183 [Claviceps purpurea]|nr:hypothetical protein E4U26_006183 [Claviceps purpurea]
MDIGQAELFSQCLASSTLQAHDELVMHDANTPLQQRLGHTRISHRISELHAHAVKGCHTFVRKLDIGCRS